MRQRAVALSFAEHSDLANDMLYVEASDGPTLCVASGDGCLSNLDPKPTPTTEPKPKPNPRRQLPLYP